MSGARGTGFDADWLAQRLRQLQPEGSGAARCVVAWSGGADSTALLAALCELRDRRGREPPIGVRAVYVDHGLQPAARAWATHCRQVARALAVPLSVRRVRVERTAGSSLEAAARDARYGALQQGLRPGELLLLAQHARDQLETLLLQLLRGSGARGLAAMPARRQLGCAWLLRPLLDVGPDALRDYLRRRDLAWVEDPSNADTDLDRNYLRAQVLPRLEQRWPALLQTTSRSARLLGTTQRVVTALAQRDLRQVSDGSDVNLPLLRRLSAARVAEVVRAWVEREGAPLPDEARLAQIVSLLHLREDAQPVIGWGDWELRRHQDRLTLASSRHAPPRPAARAARWRWARGDLQLPAGRLAVAADRHGDLDLELLPQTLLVGLRGAGRARDFAGASLDVKSLLRERGVPSWQRDDLPFLYESGGKAPDARVVAIADLWLASAVRATAATRRRGRIVWQPQ